MGDVSYIQLEENMFLVQLPVSLVFRYTYKKTFDLPLSWLLLNTERPTITSNSFLTITSIYGRHGCKVMFIFILVINQLDAQNFCFTISFFHASTCFEHHVLNIRRSKLCYTASGIITPIGGRPVHRLREGSSLNLCTGGPPISVVIPEDV